MNRVLKQLTAKLRGVVGLGVLGGAVGFLAGAMWGVGSTIVRSGLFIDLGYLRFLIRMALGNAVGFMMIGAFTAAGFGVLIAATDSRRSIEELPLWRMAFFGALAGAVFPPVFVIMKLGMSAYLSMATSLLPVMGGLSLAGGVLTASMVAAAKRADPRELTPAPDKQPEPTAPWSNIVFIRARYSSDGCARREAEPSRN